MVFLILGFGLLLALVLVVRAFVAAEPQQLARFLRWFLITLGVAAALVLFILLALSDRLLPALALAAGPASLLWRWWKRRQPTQGAGTGRTSEVETATLRMRLDHGSGEMTGTVLRGSFAGRRLDELSEAELITLWRECRVADEPASRLLETYLDRLRPDWRDGAHTQSDGDRQTAASSDAMSRDEAYALLGLAKGADAAAIREAHHKLMMKLHPDHGGSTYLAAKINRAKEILLES